MFNKIKFATGLMVTVVMTAAMFGLSLKSRYINSDQALNNLVPSRSSEVVMSTAVAEERFNYGPDTNPVSEEQGYDGDLFAALASGAVSDSQDLAALDSFDFGTVCNVTAGLERGFGSCRSRRSKWRVSGRSAKGWRDFQTRKGGILQHPRHYPEDRGGLHRHLSLLHKPSASAPRIGRPHSRGCGLFVVT